MTVSVSRNPAPWPLAILFTVVGIALIVAGFTVVEPIRGMGSNVVLEVVAVVLGVPALVIYVVVMARRLGQRTDVTAGIPQELPEPPGDDDPALVGVLVGDGTPRRRAVAGVVLGLAARKALTIDERGDRIVIGLEDRAGLATPAEALVLAQLRERADGEGRIVGPPIWEGRVPWWRAFVRDARGRAMSVGLVDSQIPLVGTMLVMVLVGTSLALVFFWRIPVFVGLILLVNGLPHLLARASGYRLTDEGRRRKAAWLAFGRFLRAQGSLRDVGPAGVVVWGPNLVYGAVLGQAERAARPLTPDADDDEPIDEVYTRTSVVEL